MPASDPALAAFVADLDSFAAVMGGRDAVPTRPAAPSLLNLSRSLPWPSAVGIHEAGHGVVGVLLARPFIAIIRDADGGQMLGCGELVTAEDLVGESAVTVGGAVAEFFFAYSLADRNRDEVYQHLSDGDQKCLVSCIKLFAQSHQGGEWRCPLGVAAVALARPGARAAVMAVARLLDHRGKLTEAEVIQVVRDAQKEDAETAPSQ